MNKVIAREYVDKNYIPKSKVREKIEECQNRKFSDFTNEPNFVVEKVLQELLGEEK